MCMLQLKIRRRVAGICLALVRCMRGTVVTLGARRVAAFPGKNMVGMVDGASRPMLCKLIRLLYSEVSCCTARSGG